VANLADQIMRTLPGFCGIYARRSHSPVALRHGTDAAAAANVTPRGEPMKIATLNDTCGNLMQVTQLMRW
jgi:hypothetical protein